MNKKDFDEFYGKTVKPIAEKFVEKNPKFTFRDDSIPLYEEYINQKTFARTLYHKDNYLTEKEYIDRHKVCACMTVAIINSKLIHYSDIQPDEELSETEISRVNEQLAFLSCWELLKAFILARNFSKKTLEEQKTEEISKVFSLPKTFHNNSFVDTMTRSLYYARTVNGLNVSLLANIYYLLEAYCEKGSSYEFK